MDKLFIIDGNSLAYRAFYALPLLSNDRGEFSNAIYGFCSILFKAISIEKPTHVAVAFDTKKPTFRHEMYSEYKGTRKKMPEELASQMPILMDILKSMNIAVYTKEGIEADDIIGTISKKTPVTTVIVTGDRDSLQLIDSSTSVFLTKKGISDVVKLDEKGLKEETGLIPSQIVDLKSLMGDASDNIPGVSGIGEKTALSLLEKYSTLDGVYKNIENITGKLKEKLVNGIDLANLSHTLATIKTDCDINFKLEDCVLKMPFGAETKRFFAMYQFKTLLGRKEFFDETISDIISEEIVPSSKKIVEIHNKEELEKAVEDCFSSPSFAFNFNDLVQFASINNSYVCSNEINMFSSCLEPSETILTLKKVLESDKELISFGNKFHMNLFSKLNIKPTNPIFDLQIALHLINGGITPAAPQISAFFEHKKRAILKLEEFKMTKLFNEVEMPLVSVLFEMEQNGCKMNEDTLRNLSSNFESTLKKLQNEIFVLADQEFNISSPKQVSDILFDKLQISTAFNKKRSTSIDFLTEVQMVHPIVPLIIRYRKFFKLKTSFLDSLISISEKNNSLIHTCFNQTLTTTGRLSSSDPNLQNIPTRDDEGKAIRSAFVSRFENGSIITADYNQIELRILASLSQDENMINAFINKQDIHRSTAAKIFGISPEEVSSKQRRDAKSVNFGVVYGISDYGLSQNIGCSVKVAKAFIDRYFEIYPNVKLFLNNSISQAKINGYTTTIFGRRRQIPELASPNKNLISFGERVAMNAPIQGSAADIIKVAMIKISNVLKEKKLKSLLVLQIHDELLIDTYPGEEKIVENILKENMENVAKLPVVLSVEVGQGKNWLEAK
ncbi:MAG: DNA polymerase I [Clostridia bacterium]